MKDVPYFYNIQDGEGSYQESSGAEDHNSIHQHDLDSTIPTSPKKSPFVVGTGIYDMTGPAAQINFMGYARSAQTGHGIHLRLRSRAFIMSENILQDSTTSWMETSREQSHEGMDQRKTTGDQSSSILSTFLWNPWRKQSNQVITRETTSQSTLVSSLDPDKTICFVSVDIGMGSDLLTHRVVQRLEELLPEQNVGDNKKRLCHLENLSISGTHTHSAPAGFLQYTLYQITSKGFSMETFDTYVESVAQSILQAFRNLKPGSIEMHKDKLFDANINRSPSSYLLNPQWERDLYQDDGNTDKTMLQLLFKHESINMKDILVHKTSGTAIGILNWFAVHGTSMNGTNTLISGDNKGYASYLMEKHVNGQETLPGQGNFVAAFASTNLGDVSPNTAGPRCLDTGEECDAITSTCNGKSQLCVAFGPGKDMQESTEIIGRKQYELAAKMMERSKNSVKEQYASLLNGTIAFRHSFVNMVNRTVVLEGGELAKTCPAALGYGFGAGTTDGPGMFDFTQGQNASSVFWNIIGGFLSPPSQEQKNCHHPKPILLNTGEASLPYSWDPTTVPISVLQVGKLFILNVPSEFTTMAGRRLRRAIKEVASEYGVVEPEIAIAGLANSYTHYVATFEEYAAQRYEAASTLYGPHTLSAYIQDFERITRDMLDGVASASDDPPEDLQNSQLSMIAPVIVDNIGLGKRYGSVMQDPRDHYTIGSKVQVSFRSANPRNNQRIEGTFLSIDRLNDDGSWRMVHVDGDWCTKYIWRPIEDSSALGVSFADIVWDIPSNTPQGLYRVCHYGTRKTWIGDLEWLLLHVPDWMSMDIFGSMAAGLVFQGIRLLSHVSESFGLSIGLWMESLGRKKDFQGCSRSFLVSAA